MECCVQLPELSRLETHRLVAYFKALWRPAEQIIYMPDIQRLVHELSARAQQGAAIAAECMEAYCATCDSQGGMNAMAMSPNKAPAKSRLV